MQRGVGGASVTYMTYERCLRTQHTHLLHDLLGVLGWSVSGVSTLDSLMMVMAHAPWNIANISNIMRHLPAITP